MYISNDDASKRPAIHIEEGVPMETIDKLIKLGHDVKLTKG